MVALSQPQSGFARVPYSQLCTVTRAAGGVEVGVLCNISVLGVYVALNDLPDVDDVLKLEFALPGVGQAVRATGTVTWQNSDEPQHVDDLPRGCGVRFEHLPEATGRQIAVLVQEHLQRETPSPKNAALRVPYLQRCRLTIAGDERSGGLCNISVLGVYVAIDPIPETGETIAISFLLPGDPRPFVADATVTWQNVEPSESLDGLPPGCGLRFANVPPAELARIEHVIRDFGARAAAYCKPGFR